MINKTDGQWEFVSVIIPVFNDEPGLRVCLAGLARQTYSEDRFEVIVVDNGSTPGVEIETGYPFAVHVEYCATPGSYAARNAGADKAKGTILAFTDADCEPQPGWLEEGVKALRRGSGRYIVGGAVEITKPVRSTGVSLYQRATGFSQRENIEKKGFTVTANVFCSSEQFRRIGPFEERLLSGGDREWSWRAFGKGIGLVYEPNAVVYTPPRVSLQPALRQARRVAAGRYYLRLYDLDHLGPEAIEPHRSITQSLFWILARTDFSLFDRLRMLSVAVLLKGVALLEMLRLRLGGNAERR